MSGTPGGHLPVGHRGPLLLRGIPPLTGQFVLYRAGLLVTRG